VQLSDSYVEYVGEILQRPCPGEAREASSEEEEVDHAEHGAEAPVIEEGYEFKRAWFTARKWRGEWGTVEVWQNKTTGKFRKKFYPRDPSWRFTLNFLLNAIRQTTFFGIEEAELKAQTELRALLGEEQRKQWVLTESFYEKGKSGVIYLVRKGRPTIAFRSSPTIVEDGTAEPLCALCLHPIGWYKNSFAGVMTPTDDVIAHLFMIRGDEHGFWKKANQHPLDIPNSGIC
jgi:hypothetical protein